MATETKTLKEVGKAGEVSTSPRTSNMKTALNKTRVFASALLVSGLMLAAPQARADGLKLTLSANGFGGKHAVQGVLAGGGLAVSGAAENGFGAGANFDIASIELNRPVPYSYGAFVSIPLADSLSGTVSCKKDGLAGTLGCGGGLSMDKGPISIGAGAEYRPGGTVSMNASIGAKVKLAFLTLKANVLGFINTKLDGISAGGANATVELMTDYHVGIFGRYLFATTGYGEEKMSSGVGGILTRFTF
jgi:hypothetical protein